MEERKIKFCHVNQKIGPGVYNALGVEKPKRSGMYNWIFVFQGDVYPFDEVKDRLHEYDVIQVNMSPGDNMLIPKIRNILGPDSKTKLVINNDYVCETWGKVMDQHPDAYDNLQKLGDMVFSTEPHQVSNMINGTFCIPHPTNTKHLKKIRSDKKANSIGSIYHWWNGENYLPWRTANLIKEENGLSKTRLYAYGSGKTNQFEDECRRWNNLMWDELVPNMNIVEFLEHLASNKLIYEPCSYHTYGRTTVETACVRVPVVGSDRVFSIKHCYPFTCCDPQDGKKARELAKKVLTEPEFRKKVVDYAFEAVEYFNYENSKKRFLDALDESVARGGHQWYAKNG